MDTEGVTSNFSAHLLNARQLLNSTGPTVKPKANVKPEATPPPREGSSSNTNILECNIGNGMNVGDLLAQLQNTQKQLLQLQQNQQATYQSGLEAAVKVLKPDSEK